VCVLELIRLMASCTAFLLLVSIYMCWGRGRRGGRMSLCMCLCVGAVRPGGEGVRWGGNKRLLTCWHAPTSTTILHTGIKLVAIHALAALPLLLLVSF